MKSIAAVGWLFYVLFLFFSIKIHEHCMDVDTEWGAYVTAEATAATAEIT